MRKLPRRRLLLAIAASGLLAGAGMALIRASGYRLAPEVAGSLKALRAWQYLVIEAVGGRILAPERIAIGRHADETISKLPVEERRDITRFITYVEHVAPISLGHFRRFTALSAAAQDQVLQSLESSSIDQLRAGFQALKALALMDFYRRRESWSKIGYDGPVIWN